MVQYGTGQYELTTFTNTNCDTQCQLHTFFIIHNNNNKKRKRKCQLTDAGAGELPLPSGPDLCIGVENVNCSLGISWSDAAEEPTGAACDREVLAESATKEEAADTAEDCGGFVGVEEVRPKLKPGMEPMGRVKSVRRFGISVTCNTPWTGYFP